MKHVARLGTLLVAVLLAASTVAVGSAAAQPQPEVNVYSGRNYDSDYALYEAFTQQTGIKVNLVEAGEDQIIQRILNEGVNSPADIMITTDAGRLWRAEQAGLFQPIRSTLLESRVPEYHRDPEGLWFGLAGRARVFVYAKDRIDPSWFPTYESLADPSLQGRLLIRSSSNIYNQSLMSALIEAHGEEWTEQWARGVANNLARPPQGGDTDQIKAVAAGEGDVAVVNTYYFARLLKSQAPEDQEVVRNLGLVFPNQGVGERGTHVNISGAGVVKNAPNRDAAIQLIEYLTSDPAQRLYADASNEYPIVDTIPLDPVLHSFGPFWRDPVNASVFGRNSPLALQIAERAGWR